MDSADQRLGIVVVAHRTPRDLLDRAMARVAAAAPEARVVVVDTGGGPTVERAASWPATLEAVATANHSYSRAVNVGLERLTTPYLVVMNADVLVERDTFDRLLTAHRGDSRAGVVGPLALTPEGRPQDLGLPYRLNYAAARRSGESGASVSWLSGCLQLFDRDLYQTIGGYDESLRFFNEDLEFCLRARRAGRRCLLVVAPVVHVGGVSTPAHPAFHVEGRRGGYVITQRYHSALHAFLHRGFLRAEALLGGWLARDDKARAAHSAMARLLASGEWQHSPFGATLDDR
ncbi:MAG TPA: glycosyltransferase [Trueperaceae bacterium]|nr:glycosyltransferase [Trueperaceae bacterium]